jgi:hypothetical protein
MTTDEPLTFDRVAGSPVVMGEAGVAIALSKVAAAGAPPGLWLHGAYRLPREDAERLGVRPLQKALIVTYVAGENNHSRNLVGETVLFDDDETVTRGVHTGYFNVDLRLWLPQYARRRYWITASLGRQISNTVLADVIPDATAG